MKTQRSLLLALCAAASIGLSASRAHAQLSVGNGGGGGGAGVPTSPATPGNPSGPGAGDEDPKKAAPPSAIPGAIATMPAAPASRNAMDLDPNAALFDAIDRGDIAAAREALGRGADLNARNVLGQRPVDLSIDLSRNDITFLLLSMRSQNGDQAPADDNSDDTAAAADTAPAPGARRTPGGAPASAPVADEFASTSHAGPGTPQPSAGFLGFGSR